MSTLSQFFGSDGGGANSTFNIFTSTSTYTIPSNVKAMAYGVIGAASANNSPTGTMGGSGGFSWWEGSVSLSAPTVLTATVGAGVGFPGTGGSSVISGTNLTTITATGGSSPATPGEQGTAGSGSGGILNYTGAGGAPIPAAGRGGSSAGGIFGPGQQATGAGGAAYSKGTGFGGEGSFVVGAPPTSPYTYTYSYAKSEGNPGFVGRGGSGVISGEWYSGPAGGSSTPTSNSQITQESAESGFVTMSANNSISLAKTFLAAAGGGGMGAIAKAAGPVGNPLFVIPARDGAAGGGGGAGSFPYPAPSPTFNPATAGNGGFGSGGGGSMSTNPKGRGGFGGCHGSLSTPSPTTPGIAVVEFWT